MSYKTHNSLSRINPNYDPDAAMAAMERQQAICAGGEHEAQPLPKGRVVYNTRGRQLPRGTKFWCPFCKEALG